MPFRALRFLGVHRTEAGAAQCVCAVRYCLQVLESNASPISACVVDDHVIPAQRLPGVRDAPHQSMNKDILPFNPDRPVAVDVHAALPLKAWRSWLLRHGVGFSASSSMPRSTATWASRRITFSSASSRALPRSSRVRFASSCAWSLSSFALAARLAGLHRLLVVRPRGETAQRLLPVLHHSLLGCHSIPPQRRPCARTARSRPRPSWPALPEPWPSPAGP